jgi:hypothetical protein
VGRSVAALTAGTGGGGRGSNGSSEGTAGAPLVSLVGGSGVVDVLAGRAVLAGALLTGTAVAARLARGGELGTAGGGPVTLGAGAGGGAVAGEVAARDGGALARSDGSSATPLVRLVGLRGRKVATTGARRGGLSNVDADRATGEVGTRAVERVLEVVLGRELDVAKALGLALGVLYEADRDRLEVLEKVTDLVVLGLESEVADKGSEGGNIRKGDLLADLGGTREGAGPAVRHAVKVSGLAAAGARVLAPGS